MRHLFPIDLPQSTEITAIATIGNSPDYIELEMLEGKKRILGYVLIGEHDVAQAQHQEPAPTMDFRTISRLLRECETQHNHDNWDLPRYQTPINIQLIDVEDMMIIPATTQYRYLALSYVWGGYDSFATTTKNRDSLGQKEGLSKHTDEIPQTIKDAMDVVRRLGERYLWVDRLCIEQDNTTQKQAHIQKMDVIYSHALVTIIAYAGVAATSPLPGLRPGTRLGLPTKRGGDVVMSVSPPSIWESGAPHETRGWTLQEQLMSKRCLYFDFHTTWFQCGQGMYRELDRTAGHSYKLLQPPISFNMHSLGSIQVNGTRERGLEDIWKLYAMIVQRYRTRKLRYAKDTVHAIQGIAQLISDLLGTPLISAVPMSFLPRALRFHLSPQGLSPERIETVPSWSWAGWKDPAYFDDEVIAERLPVEAVESQVKVRHKTYTYTKAPIEGVLQPYVEVVNLTEGAAVQTPLYTVLDVECFSTKASTFKVDMKFRVDARGTVVKKNTGKSGIFGMLCQVYERGQACGYCLGGMPNVSEDDYYSDDFQWILLSRSQPVHVSVQTRV
ncbi:hypothetical protein INS49_014133 [Diaporthe citri]|uniref:uncharacterized protein n=1 Tax=Diaporthe citri TaxID=83186 RepID=UPI001C80EDDD|nr:uncharacterized protein INS49_014133 [Diaporthe citri]KAG6358249.1 hypothetical protein INS49_014133 [Diaporthe citri]